MLKLIKFMKPFAFIVLVIVALLFGQAMCDLSLPDYMSNIVNVGIQQGGIENAVPGAIRKTEFDKITLFLTDSQKADVAKYYTLADKQAMNQDDYAGYLKKYTNLEKEPVYILNTKDKKVIDNLNGIMGKAILAVYGIETKGLTEFAGSDAQKIPAGTDPFALISQIPADKRDTMFEKMNSTIVAIPDVMIKQVAVEYIKTEYTALGVNFDNLQSSYILHTGLLMLLIALLSMAATVSVGFLAARVAAGLGRNVRKAQFAKVVEFSGTEFDKFSTASLITRSTNDIQQIQMLMVMLLRIVFYAPILGVGGIIRVLSTDTNMGWIIAVAVMAILTIVLVMFSIAVPKFKIIQKLVDKLNLATRESLEGMPVIRAFNTQNHEEKKFDKANVDLTRTNLFVNRVMALMMPLMMLLMNGISILIVWVGAHQIDQGVMQVGSMMAFIQYAMMIIMSFLMISMVSIMLPRASVAAQRVAEVINTKTTINDPEQPKTINKENIAGKPGTVEFKNVSFRYPGAEDDVLKNITFIAKPGQTTAFIGSTGSGKSTLVNLIPRFYDVTDGQILIDNIDIRDVTQHDLRDRIGYVPQKGSLFSGTIESNLKYGDEEASQDLLEKAANVAQALEFIKEKPEGFAAPVAQGGTNVSGGQKQRLSIARALVKEADIYIFDDSFSALDFKTDAALRNALKAEVADSAILIVAQRINTIMNADQIIVLEDGMIAGKGTHKELMENCDVYKEIALSQLSKEELVS